MLKEIHIIKTHENEKSCVHIKWLSDLKQAKQMSDIVKYKSDILESWLGNKSKLSKWHSQKPTHWLQTVQSRGQ